MIVGPAIMVPAIRARLAWGWPLASSLEALATRSEADPTALSDARRRLEEAGASCPDGCSRQYGHAILIGLRAENPPATNTLRTSAFMMAAWCRTLEAKLEEELGKLGKDET
jgi:hypothetical protein